MRHSVSAKIESLRDRPHGEKHRHTPLMGIALLMKWNAEA